MSNDSLQPGGVALRDPFYGAPFVEAVRRFWRKYTVFTGRASRAEFWWWWITSFAVGLVGLSSLVPMVCFGLYGGAIADVMDRRRLALIASIGLWLLSLVLVAQAVLGLERAGLLYAVVAAQPDDAGDVGGELAAPGVGELVVHRASEVGEHRVGALGRVAPRLAREVGRELHEARARLRRPVPAP